MHDVLAHSMSVVSVQATVGAHLAVEDPAAARQALLTISDVSRSSMQDLRQMLALLRDDSAATPGEDVTYEPARGVASLEPLIETYRSAGLPVTLTTGGTPRELTASVDLCAYRIVQEALTNTLKHAEARAASVTLTYAASALEVVVADDGRGHGPATGGHGLIGMRERTAVLGGRLTAGPAAGRRLHRDGHHPLHRRHPRGCFVTGPSRPIRVAVAEDQALVRSGFVALLQSDPDLEVVGEAEDGLAALDVARRTRPDVMLMDIRMPGLDGVTATGRITNDPATAGVRVLILTTFDADQYVHDALRAGASGFLLKDVLAADLLQAVKVVAAG